MTSSHLHSGWYGLPGTVALLLLSSWWCTWLRWFWRCCWMFQFFSAMCFYVWPPPATPISQCSLRTSVSCTPQMHVQWIALWPHHEYGNFLFGIMCRGFPSVLWCCWLGGRKSIRPVKNWVVGCWHGYLTGASCRLAYGPADAVALIVSCFSKIQIDFTFLVPAHPGSPGKGPLNGCVVPAHPGSPRKTGVCVCVLCAVLYRVQLKNISRTFSGSISPATGNFYIKFYTPLLCSCLCKITQFYSAIFNFDKDVPY